MKDLNQTDAAKWLDANCRYRRSIDATQLRQVLQRKERHCTWCGARVTGRRTKWCSDACVNAWKSRCDRNYITAQLLQRDEGVCALCGTDTLRLAARLRRLRSHSRGYRPGQPPLRKFRPHSHERVKRLWRHWIGSKWHGGTPPQPWQADHVLPVVAGGGCCDVGGYRTLCIPCHKQVTAELAAGRAAERRDADRKLLTEDKP